MTKNGQENDILTWLLYKIMNRFYRIGPEWNYKTSDIPDQMYVLGKRNLLY